MNFGGFLLGEGELLKYLVDLLLLFILKEFKFSEHLYFFLPQPL